ncbi:AfsR/SARP family transcriptional regulator [Catenuloplanes atrovinosus]|uniref:DNA-binding SARP family transcriptional activator n=1 Tax=Catenuloplanes atrovinosus TaxID=137266 RepID=A0AAE4CCB6_9ACTN|nr:BTAD domain-containing putative transcriptional regulator [Catenuloplanes atrovinosus]MDR7276375.1 DNA-binding SARP family transcriptional activator [Catenuloplanes atrovinosus]
MTSGGIRFALLGPVRAWDGATELPLGSPQQRTVLAALLLREGAMVTVDELVAAVWGDEPPRSAINTVRTYLSRLRTLLRDAATIVSVGGGYALPVDREATDVTVFHAHVAEAREARRRGDPEATADALRAAVALHRGRPLSGAGGPYADAQRTRLEQQMLAARIDLLAAEVDLGHAEEAIPELVALADEHPLRERVHELLMLALYQAGRQADALAVYQDVRLLLADELGIDPGAGLQSAHRRILAADPDLVLPAVHPAATTPRTPIPRSGSQRPGGVAAPLRPRRHRRRTGL